MSKTPVDELSASEITHLLAALALSSRGGDLKQLASGEFEVDIDALDWVRGAVIGINKVEGNRLRFTLHSKGIAIV